ncbi:4-hydroxy-tetrahydrodipicolinate synthase [Hahella sp. CR1]|uniref:4-hydroxy-tetrahydrodipicolinate synthase n=1 Tax=unclassified Hahella TaxID=2624107 RepID=UPI0024435A77|nr:4-hydroxy-tetrahydrodipicolinate synthase [Hahella sp. CR1]MDG9670305.1 4-hydroxy-tetrahydrodipicolinate synthase [Hahella sp. CR1]
MFRGSLIAMITPFINGQVDEKALAGLVDWQIKHGAHGLVPVGTTGESPTLTEEEHKRVVALVAEQAHGRVPVIAGAGSNNPVEAVRYAQHAQQAGADAVLCVAGYYNRPSQEGLYQHFKMVHDAIDIPIIVYNIPPRAVVDIKPETMARLAELPRIVGVKDATTDLARISRERMLINKPFSFLSGDDMTAIAYNASGGQGCISVSANIAPDLYGQMQTATLQGDFREALRIHDLLAPLHEALFREPSPAGAKYAASLLGLCKEECRLPIVPLSEQAKSDIKNIINELYK